MTTTRVERHPWTPDSDDGHADLASHDTWIDGVPYATLERLRHEEPVSWVDEEEGSGFWAVTRYSDVIDANHRWDDLTSFRGIRLEEMDAEETEARRTMMELDPPAHTRLRRLVNRGFTRRTVESYEDPIRDLTGGILDDALALGEFDFVAEVARVLPMRMLGRLLGVPDEHAEQLVDWGDQLLSNSDPEYTDHVVDQVDTDGVEPTGHSVDLTSVMRDDEATESLPIDDMLANAPAREEDLIRVRAVLE